MQAIQMWNWIKLYGWGVVERAYPEQELDDSEMKLLLQKFDIIEEHKRAMENVSHEEVKR